MKVSNLNKGKAFRIVIFAKKVKPKIFCACPNNKSNQILQYKIFYLWRKASGNLILLNKLNCSKELEYRIRLLQT